MKAFLTAGGFADIEFLKESYSAGEYDLVIGIDGGSEYLYKAGIKPDVLVGDFDTLSLEILEYYSNAGVKILKHLPQKDNTDTELALLYAIDSGCDEIELYSATGSRIDHVLGNIQSLMIAYKQGIKAYIIDKNNRIHYTEKKEIIKKQNQYGKYVSFVPMTNTVTGVNLKGFVYPLKDATLTNDRTLTISNEIQLDEAVVWYDEGVLLMIESRD